MTRSALFTKHQNLAVRMSKDWQLQGADEEDVRQELRIALWEATGSWDSSRGVPFEAFARDVMRRRMLDAITAAGRLKHQMLTFAVRTARSRDDDGPQRMEVLDYVTSRELEPPEMLEQLEELRGVVGAILGLTPKERKSIIRMINGLGPDSKEDDNALYRARRKLQRTRRTDAQDGAALQPAHRC